MTKKMLIDASHAEETRVVVLDGSRLEDFDVETATRKQIKGNIYLAKVIRVEPSLQAAFVEYGGNRHGFLAFGEIHPDYYQIPVADRQRLLAMAAAEEAAEAEAEEGPILDGNADAIAPEPELVEVKLEREDQAQAQPLGVTPIDIISAPPPETDAEAAEAAAAEAAVLEWAAPEPAYPEPAVPEPAPADTAHAEVASLFPGAELALDGQEAELADPGETGELAPASLIPAAEFAPAQIEPGEEEPASAEETALPPAPESLGGDGDDAAEARERRQRQRFLRNYKIQEVIHRRQIMLIQVVKEERGNKGAALTTYLSLAGRFSVLMPNSPTGGGVSRKITSVADRRRLKEAVAELEVPQGMGLIVRTAGANRPKPEIKRDCEYLLRLWDDIRDRTLQSIAPALIYEEANLIKRTIRDVYTRDVDEIYVDGEEGFRAARDFMRMLMPSHARKVQLWSDGQPLFARFQVEAQLDAMLNPIVQLRSGGYIVINQTEALVAIDVNSGRSTRERSIEDTALRTNLEAAEEVARQLRMRDLAGLIVIDFIDMEARKNNAAVERRLKDALKNDRARIQVGSISHFGLMEMSRQRLRPSLAEASLVTCPHCAGMGHVRSPESAALHILRAIEDEGAKFRAAEIVVTLPPDVALYLFNHKRDRLSAIEARYGMRVIFTGDPGLTAANFRIEKTKAQSAPPPVAPQVAQKPVPEAAQPAIEAEDEDEADLEEGGDAEPSSAQAAAEAGEDGERRRRRRRRRRGRRGEPGAAGPAPAEVAGEDTVVEDAPPIAPESAGNEAPSEMDLVLAAELGNPDEAAPEAEPAAEAEEKPRRRRSRGGRRRAAAAEPAPVQEDIVYTDIADIFEAAERAEQTQRVKTHLTVAPEPEAELPPEVHVPETLLEPVSHAVFEPAEAPDGVQPDLPETTVTAADPTAPEPAAPEPTAPEPTAPEPAAPEPAAPEPAAPLSLVKPTLIGTGVPTEKKRGWWRR